MGAMMQKIEVMVFEPGKPGEARSIDDSLEAMQAVVGGYIEQVGLAFGPLAQGLPAVLVVICNEDGRPHGLPLNRWGLLGTFFVVRQKGTEYVSLTEADRSLIARIEREQEDTAKSRR